LPITAEQGASLDRYSAGASSFFLRGFFGASPSAAGTGFFFGFFYHPPPLSFSAWPLFPARL